MTPVRRRLFWALSSVFLAGCLLWTAWIPEYRHDLSRLVPPQAGVILRPHDLAGEWREWLANPAVAGLLAGAGTSTNQIRKWRDDAATADQLRRIAPGDCVLAHVPSLGPAREPAWLLVSWLGGRSQLLRWALKTGRVPGATRIFNRHGHLVWRLASRDLPPDQTLTVSVAEGMAVVCLSRDLGAIIEALDGADGLLARPRPGSAAWPRAPDTGAAGVFRSFGAWTPPDRVWRFDISSCSSQRLAATAHGPWPTEWPSSGPETNSRSAWNPAQRDAVIRLSLDRELALFGAGRILPDLPSLAGELVRRDAVGPLQISVVDGPYAGRSRGMKLPTVLFGLALVSEPVARARLGVLTDVINRTYRWGLVHNEIGAGPYRPAAVESTSETLYARFALHEQLAVLVTNRTLVLAGNTEGFTNLLVQVAANPPPAPPALALAPDAVAEAWMDLRDGGKALRLLLTAWSLNVDERDRARTERIRGEIHRAKSWVTALAPLGTARVAARRDAGELIVDVELGGRP